MGKTNPFAFCCLLGCLVVSYGSAKEPSGFLCGDATRRPETTVPAGDVTLINAFDSVIFDLSQAFCTPTYAQFPVYIKSDDLVFALDFSFRFNLSMMSYASIVIHKGYVIGAANYNGADSTLRFTSFSMVPMQSNTPLISVRFNMNAGQINASDLYNILPRLNGDNCSYGIPDGPATPAINPLGPTVLDVNDSLELWVTSAPGNTFIWSTGATSQSIYVDTAGIYSVTVSTPAGCSIFLSIAITMAEPLPVELVEFRLGLHASGVQVSWLTATEINNDYFMVERSADGKPWREVVRVKGAGHSNVPRSYETFDPSPATGLNWYRLKQTDYDGRYSYSDSRSIRWPGDITPLAVTAWPVPAHGILHVELSAPARVQLSDLRGKIVICDAETDGALYRTLDLRHLGGAMFLLKAHNDESVVIRRIIVH